MNNQSSHKITPSFSKLLIFIGIITLIHWLVLIFQIPILTRLAYWDYKLHITPVEFLWIFLAFIAFGLAILLSLSNLNYLKLIGIILLGTVIQYGFSFSKGDGLEAFSSKMTGMGHAEFAKVAVRPISVRSVIMEYEILISEKYYGFLPSKPPGTLLVYVLTNNATDMFLPSGNKEERLENFATFASFTWPLMSLFVVIPIFFLTRNLFNDPETGIIASLFYISVPALNLITMVTDQALYPFLAVCSVLLIAISIKYNSLMLAFLSGVFFYTMLYFSFGMAVIAFFCFTPLLNTFDRKSFASHIWRLASFSFGVIVAGLSTYYFTGYDIFVRYAGAIDHHLRWKNWENNFETYFASGITNLTEFAIWIGLPLTVLFLINLSDSIRQLMPRKQPTALSFYNLAITGIFIFLLIFGKTKAETARLWMFLVPFLCISVANFINRQNWTSRNKTIFTITNLFLQLGTTFLTLYYQDFG